MGWGNTCCKGCEKRKVNCHAWCEDYQEWNKKHREQLDKIQKAKEAESISYVVALERHKKYLQRIKSERGIRK